MPKRKYTSHSAKDFTGMHTKRPIKYGMGGPMVIRTNAVQQYTRYENKWNKDMKSFKKQDKMLYSIAKKSGSRREIQKIKNIRKEASK